MSIIENTATCTNCGGPQFGFFCNPDKGCEETGGLPLDGPAPSGRRAAALRYLAVARESGAPVSTWPSGWSVA